MSAEASGVFGRPAAAAVEEIGRRLMAQHNEYRTKRLILEIYDAMADADASGAPYSSPFDKVGTK